MHRSDATQPVNRLVQALLGVHDHSIDVPLDELVVQHDAATDPVSGMADGIVEGVDDARSSGPA